MSQSVTPIRNDASPATPAPSTFNFDRLPYAALIVWVACIALAVLCNSGSILGVEWIWTDDALIARNPLIGMLSGLQQVWSGMLHPDTYLLPQFSPLSQTMFYVERALFGDHPLGYRIVSMILHGSCGAMLYVLLRGLRLPGAIVVTLLFVAHPMLVDSVSFLTERRNPLGGLLGLAALYVFFRACGTIEAPIGKYKLLPDDKVRLYLIGIALFVAGLFAQPAIAPLVMVAVLVLWVRHQKIPNAFALIVVAIAVLGAGLLAISSRVELAHSGYSQKQWERAPTPAGEFAVRTQIAGRATFVYLQKLLLPYPLSMDYGRWVTPNDLEEFRKLAPDATKERFANMTADVGADRILAWGFPLAAIAILVTLGVLSKTIGRAPFALAASFLLLLLPFLGFVDLGWMQYSFVSHRAVYLAAIPILISLVLALAPILSDPSQRVSMIASLVIVLIVLVRLAVGVSFRYQFNLKLWRDSDFASNSKRSQLNFLTRSPWYSRFQAANSLLQLRPDELAKSLDAYNDVLEKIRPGNPEVLVQLGRVLYALKQDQEAMNRFAFVMEYFPDFGLAYRAAGDLLRRQADQQPTNPAPRLGALAYYEQATKVDPLDAASKILLAETAWEIAKRLPDSDAEGIKARMAQTAEAFDAADEIRPYDVEQLLRESRTLIEMKLLPSAASRLLAARAVEPQNPEVLLLIGDASMAGGEQKGAESAYRQALELDPKLVDIYLNYSAMLASQLRYDDAQELLEKGLKEVPEHAKLLDAIEKLKAFRMKDPTSQPAKN